MILIDTELDALFRHNSYERMMYEKTVYDMRKLVLKFLSHKGISTYQEFKLLVLTYLPKADLYDFACFWEGITFKEAVLEQVNYILFVAVDRIFKLIKES